MNSQAITLQIKELLEEIKMEICRNNSEAVVWLYDNGEYFSVKAKHIIYCSAEAHIKGKTVVHFWDEKEQSVCHLISSYGIGNWDERLSPYMFCRIHRSYLINYRLIKTFSRIDNTVKLEMVDEKFPVSKSGRKLLLDLMFK